jgi:hypothetical protein
MGLVIKYNAADNTITSTEEKTGVIEKMVAGLTNVFADAATTAVTMDIYMWGLLGTNAATFTAASMVTRSRAEQGKPAIARFWL